MSLISRMANDTRHDNRFWELLAPELPRMQAFCHKLECTPEDGDDLLQDTVLSALRGFAKLRCEDAFRSWLYRIAVNNFKSGARKRNADSAMTSPLTTEVSDTAQDSDREAVEAAKERLNFAMASLSRWDRALVVLHEIEGWSYGELSEMTGKKEGALRTRLSRAKETMRNTLVNQMKRAANETDRTERAKSCVAVKSEGS